MNVREIYLNDYLCRYAMYESSSADAPYGVFLMGNLQQIESVNYFSEYFSNHLNVLVVEVPGTGLTEPLPASFTMQEQADLLKLFMEKIHIDFAHVLAFSYACPVALELCSIWAGALSLSMCGGMAGIPEASRLATMSILADAIRDKRRFADEFIKGLTVDNDLIPRGNAIARTARRKVLQYTEKQVSCFCENTIRILSYKPSNFSNINLPCLLFVGEFDPYVTIDNAKELSTQLPCCRFYSVKNADHLVHLQHPETTAQLMIQLSKECNHSGSFENNNVCVV